jgi:hypothetical protein
MRADVVVVAAPSLQLFTGVGKGQEPVRVHALGPDAAVEGLGEGVVGGLARPGEVQRHTPCVGPQVEVAGDELGPLVDPDRLRIADRGTDLFEGSNHVLAAIRDAGIERRREPRERVDHRQHPDLPAGRQLVVDEPKAGEANSMAQTSFGLAADERSSRSFAFTRRFGVLFRS